MEKTLDKLAEEINQEHQAVRRAFKTTFRSALRAGYLLNEAKAQAGHGNYTAWVEENCEFSDRTARDYTRLARNRDTVEQMLKTADAADLTIKDVLRELSAPKGYVLTDSKPKERVPVGSTNQPPSPVAGATVLTRQKVEGPFRWPNAAPTPSPQTDWTDEEQALFKRMKAGETVVVNMRNDGHPNLVAWAKANGRFVRIDRESKWGNPFETPGDGDRDTVVENFEQHYLPYKRSLLNKLEEIKGGKVLGCWCAPKRCHGYSLKARAEA
jgi:hypothetical protein